MKKIISLALTLCMVISLFVAAIPAQAAVTLPDETITDIKEVTKTVSITDFKALSLYSNVQGYLTAFDKSYFVDSDVFSGGKALLCPSDSTLGTQWTADFWYPLTDAQTLKEVSFKVNNKVESYIYFAANNANGLYVGRYGKRSSGYLGRNAGSATLANADGVDATANTLDSLNALGSTALQKLTGGNSWATITKTYVEGANGSTLETGGVPSGNTYDIVYTYENSKTDFTIINSDGASMTDTIVEGTQKNYPVIRLISNGGKAYHISEITITYIEEVSFKADVEAFVEANPLSLEIRNGLAIDDIPSAKLGEYATKAASLKENFAVASAELQEVLKDYGYYNESLVDLIVNINNVAEALPDEIITDIKEVTKTVSITDFKVLSLYSNVQGYLTAFDKSYFVDSDVFSGGKALLCPSDSTLGTQWTADFWYPLTDAQTLKEVSFKVNNKVESYIYFAANNANGLYVGRYGKRSSGYLGRNAGSATLANADGVDTTANTLDSLNVSGSTALQKLTGGNSWATITKTYVEGANGSTLETGGVPYGYTYDIVYTYENSKTDFTIINSDGASMTDTIVEGTQKNYPVIRLISNGGKAYHISDITITYTEPVDVKAQVAQFVEANPFALDIRKGIDFTGDLSKYAESADALTAAYNAADEDLQATLTEYGYYDEEVISTIVGGTAAINEYKAEHSVALGISALAVKDIAASYESYKALYDAAVADLSSVESYIVLGMGADIKTSLAAAEASLAEALEYKSFIPEILGATIKNRLDNQDMRFAVNMSKNVPEGKVVAEYGMILADYRNITSGALSLADLNVDNTEDSRVIIGKSKEASNDDLGTTYYVNVGGISEEDYGAPIIARAYVKFTDGSVIYSDATTDGADYATRTGVKDGYAVRSIISITKSMLVYLDSQKVDVSSVAKVENGVITAYITAEGQEANAPDDAKRLFSLIQQNVSYLANK